MVSIWTKPAQEAERIERSRENERMGEETTMRALFLRVAIGTCAAISLAASAANAQSVKPKYPGEIAAASDRIAERNEYCRTRAQHLHLVKRYRFMRDCKRQ